MKNKIKSLKELQEIVFQLKKDGKKVIGTSGCFDILHAGHVTYLEEAASQGDVLIVFLNSDASVRQLKGDKRPIVGEEDRAVVIAGLACVDYVCIFDELTPCDMYRVIQPDAIVKGGDYRGKVIPEMEVVRTYGGEVRYVDLVNGCSTTNIVKKIETAGRV